MTASMRMAALLLAAGIAPAAAQDQLEEIVVIGTYLEDASFEKGAQLSIDREQLEVMKPAEPEQLLQRLPGVSVFRPGGPGGISEVFLRGAESNFTAVLIDGARLNNPSNTRGGSFDFSTLAVNEIRQIDIAMGAMSAIYGSDAMAGIMRIDTAWPEPGAGSVFVEAGTESDWRAGAATSVGLGEATSLGLRVSEVEGGDEIGGSNLERTNVSAQLAGSRRNGDRWQFNVRHVDENRTSYPEVSGGPELAILSDLETTESEQLSVSATAEWTLSPDWETEIIASWAELDDEIDTPAVPPGVLDAQPGFISLTEYQRGQLLWINRVSAGDRSHFAFGLEFIDEDGQDDGAIDLGFMLMPNTYRLERETKSGFVEWGYEWGAGLMSNMAVRFDDADGASETTGKLVVAKAFDSNGGRLWASVANGFKLPSFFALGNPLFGNPNLEPEQVTSFEVGYDRRVGDNIDTGISVFNSEYQDLVDFDFETFTHINRGETDIKGIFAHATMQLSPTVMIGIDATATDSSSASGRLRRRPEHTGGVNVTWHTSDAWSMNASVRYVGERLTTSIPTGDVEDDAYVSADATIRYSRSGMLSIWFAIDNAFDAHYQDAPGFPAPGMQARLGAEVNF